MFRADTKKLEDLKEKDRLRYQKKHEEKIRKVADVFTNKNK